MDILVCIKQVPASNKVEVDPVTGVLLRNGADSKMNPYDLYALETALKIREEVGGTISVISMGPPQAEKHLPWELTVEHYYQTEDLVEPMYWQQVIRSHRESRRWEILT